MAIQSTNAASHGREEILLDGYAYIGDKPNHTTAIDFTRKLDRIVASLWSERPPLPSRLYVHSPDLDSSAFSELPRILCVVEGLILFRVAIQCRQPRCILKEECDYYIYDVDSAYLQGIPNPSPVSLGDDDVGLLPRGGGRYTVAAMLPTRCRSVFRLHLLHSEIGSWTSVEVPLKAPHPQREFPVEIPRGDAACRLLSYHSTSTVITLGGEGGTMGWVDLWYGILLCDVLRSNPELRDVPLPLPRALFLPNGETRINFVCPRSYRGIAFIKEEHCLRFVDLDITCQRLPDPDETGEPDFRFDGWSITTWSNFNLTDSYDDWKMDCLPAHADNILLNDQMQKRLLEYQLLQPKPPSQDNSVAADSGQQLENLWVFQPTPSMDVSNVVYLIARAKFLQPEAYVLAVDMRNKELQGVTEFGNERELCAATITRHGSVSKYKTSSTT